MPRMARLVVPGYPHHVTQRGSRRQQTFFRDGDYRTYVKLLAGRLRACRVTVWAYCLMPNHVHLVVVPETETGLADLFRTVHARYARTINETYGWQGHLWQERFHSFVMDEPHLLAAVRYVELNPVRAGLCPRPEHWPWSSVHAHLGTHDDPLMPTKPMHEFVRDWREYLAEPLSGEQLDVLRKHSNTGRPVGEKTFVRRLEALSGRSLVRNKPGPKPGRLWDSAK